jgi:hypothetical protein
MKVEKALKDSEEVCGLTGGIPIGLWDVGCEK